jgi:hypothetical protein
VSELKRIDLETKGNHGGTKIDDKVMVILAASDLTISKNIE